MIRYNGDLDGCMKKRNEIEEVLSQMFKNAKKCLLIFSNTLSVLFKKGLIF